MLPELKKRVGSAWDNKTFQAYLKNELEPVHVCPVCNLALGEYKPLYLHIHKKHADKLNDEAVMKALDPLDKVKEIVKEKEDPALVSLGEYFAELITSDHNQFGLVTLLGKMGLGKSYAAMRIGETTARAIANIKGGSEKKYFSIDNIAIMKLDSILPIMETMDKNPYNIIILDDIGSSYSAREFNSKINKNINKIIQTFRDTNCLVILTTPNSFLLDKVPRRLAHLQIEITEARHAQGVTIGKMFEVIDQFRNEGKPHYHYPYINGVKYTRVVFKRASDEIVAAYDKKRKEIRMSMMAESIANIRDADNEDNGDNVKPEKIPKHIQIADSVEKLITANPKITDAQLSLQLGTSRVTIGKAKQYLNECGEV